MCLTSRLDMVKYMCLVSDWFLLYINETKFYDGNPITVGVLEYELELRFLDA